MKGTIASTLILACALALSGCIGDDAPTAQDGDLDPKDQGDEGGDNNTTDGVPDLPTAVVTPNITSGVAALAVAFDLTSTHDGAGFYDWLFDADGDGTTDESGYGLPAEATYEYLTAGTYVARLQFTDLEGRTGNATATVTVSESPVVPLPKPIYFNGTISGVFDPMGGYLVGGPVNLTFNLTVPVSRIHANLSVDERALDLDWSLVRPDGVEAEAWAKGNDPTGLTADPADPPLVEEDAEDLAFLGTWTIVLEPFLSHEGAYAIVVTFE